EPDRVTQFHIAQAIARLSDGWTPSEEERLVRWFLGVQTGWFTEFAGKGVEFPMFWATALADFGRHHRAAVLRDLARIDFAGQLGGVVLDLLIDSPQPEEALIALYRANKDNRAKVKIIGTLKRVPSKEAGRF